MTGKNSLRLIWKIRDFPFCLERGDQAIFSPVFKTALLNNIRWNLVLYPRIKPTSMRLYLQRGYTTEDPETVSVDYELSFVKTDGLDRYCSEKRVEFKGGFMHRHATDPKDRGVLFGPDRKKYLENDNLQIECRIEMSDVDLPENVTIAATTQISVSRSSFFWVLPGFGVHKRVIPLRFEFGPLKAPWLKVKLTPELSFTGKVKIIKELHGEILLTYVVSILNAGRFPVTSSDGSHFCEGKDEIDEWEFDIPVMKGAIAEEIRQLLVPNKELTLYFEFVFSDGIRSQIVDEQAFD